MFDELKKQVFPNAGSFPFGRLGTGPRPTDDLTVPTRDAVFHWQLLGEPNDDFGRLTADSLMQAKICETKYYAKDVFRTCQQIGVINKDTGYPDTTKINKEMVSKIAIISVPKQRELVNLLFFWEEELTRWRLLCQEEDELAKQAQSPDIEEDTRAAIEQRLSIVRATKRIPPSKRHEDGRIIEDDLPSYEDSRRR